MGPATHTFLFTDIEGSTRLWEEHPDSMAVALVLHDQILGEAVGQNGGTIFKHTGDGIAASFDSPVGAASAAVDSQRSLAAALWPDTGPLRVRMGIHTGDAVLRDGDYYGTALNKAARLMGVGHGGQILLSDVTAALIGSNNEWQLEDLGVHSLRDLSEPVQLLQVVGEGLPSGFPELRSLDAYPSNLPHNLSDYVGREDLVEEIEQALRKSPIITLVGIGGVGKTRLSQQVGAQVLPRFKDGVWFVDLADLNTAEAVLSALARTLSVKERASEDIMVTLTAAVRNLEALVILDNSEQVAPIVADLVEQVTRSSSHLRLIVTSRSPLGVYGERVMRLEGLSGEAATALFVQRAREAGAPIDLGSDQQVIEELCRRLDGLPLAIELAAARTRSMSPRDILDRIDERFRILKGSERRVDRHRTLEAMVDWSYGLLAADEALLLDRLSVFVGSFDLASAEEVCGDDQLDRADVLDVLDNLVQKSLVSVDPSTPTTRYRLLETVKQYALRRLGDVNEAELRDRHVRYFAGRAQTLGARLRGGDMAQASAAIGFDTDNLNAAIDRLTQLGRHEEKTQVVTALAVYWTTHAPTAGRQRYEELVSVADTLEPDLRMATLIAAASLLADQGYATRSLELLDQARALADSTALEVPPYLFYVAGNVAEMDGRSEDVIHLAETGIELAEAEGDEFIGLALRSRLVTSLAQSDPDQALQRARELKIRAHEFGSDIFVAASHFLEGTVHMLSGRLEQADECFERAIETAGEALPQVVIGAKVEAAVGHLATDPARSRLLAVEALEIEARSDVMPAFRAIAGDLVATIWLDEGRLHEAALVLAAGRGLRERLGFRGVWWAQPIADQAWSRVGELLHPEDSARAMSRGSTMADADVRRLITTTPEGPIGQRAG